MPISEDIGDHVKGSTITPRSLHGSRRELIDILRLISAKPIWTNRPNIESAAPYPEAWPYFFFPCAATASMAAFTFSGSPR
jgi:hypothetical protein